MDSQATLVNPTELPDRFANTEFVFDRDSLTHADLRLRGGSAVIYTIRTPGRSVSRTELCKLEGADPVRLVRIQRNEVLPDTITFLGSTSMKLKKWIKDRTFSVSVPGIGERTYVWKPTGLREIALYDQQNALTPVAWFRTAYRHTVDGVDVLQMPTLSLQPEVEGIAHLVLASLLIVEQKYRTRSQQAVEIRLKASSVSDKSYVALLADPIGSLVHLPRLWVKAVHRPGYYHPWSFSSFPISEVSSHPTIPTGSTMSLMQEGIQSALSVLQINDDILEAKLGDVLLFHHDAAHPHRTVVVSAYSKVVYYTLLTDAGGSYTKIMKGAVGFGAQTFTQGALLATVSTARKHRLWNPNPSSSHLPRPLTQGVMALFRPSSHFLQAGNEKNPGSDAVRSDKTGSPECGASGFSEKTLAGNEAAEVDEQEARNRSLTSDVSRDREMLLITYGKAALGYVKDGLRMEKHAITLSMPDTRYELSIDETNAPAMFAVDAASGTRSKVVWSREAGKRVIGGELQTVFPAALIFYPEARRCLDAVIIGLVAWQQKMLSAKADARTHAAL